MVTEDSRIYVGSIVHLVNRGTSHRVAPGMPRKRSLRMSGLAAMRVHDFPYAGIGFTRQLSAAVKVKRRLTALIRKNWAADDSALLAKLV